MKTWGKRTKQIAKKKQENAETWGSGSFWSWKLLIVMAVAVALVLWLRL